MEIFAWDLSVETACSEQSLYFAMAHYPKNPLKIWSWGSL